MYKNHHPNAYLQRMRNTEAGLLARTKILIVLEKDKTTISKISFDIGISYAKAFHHLQLLRTRKIVERTTLKTPFIWRVTGYGYTRLNGF